MIIKPTITERECRRCKIVKPVSELKKDNRNGDGYSSFCTDCHRDSTKAWQKANRPRLREYQRELNKKHRERNKVLRKARYDSEKIRWRNLLRLYGASQEWYEGQLAKQGGGCAICGRTADEFSRALSVDHDHSCCVKTPTCGKCKRGILCHHCNTTLHAMERQVGWMKAAIMYLGEESNDESL